MAFDIYGQPLHRGYCEVHPNIHEEYPCSMCIAESDVKHQRNVEDNRRRQKEFELMHLQDDFNRIKEKYVDLLKRAVEHPTFYSDKERQRYFKSQCQDCKAIFLSLEMDGGGQIADTGDYDDACCPVCNSKNVEDVD